MSRVGAASSRITPSTYAISTSRDKEERLHQCRRSQTGQAKRLSFALNAPQQPGSGQYADACTEQNPCSGLRYSCLFKVVLRSGFSDDVEPTKSCSRRIEY